MRIDAPGRRRKRDLADNYCTKKEKLCRRGLSLPLWFILHFEQTSCIFFSMKSKLKKLWMNVKWTNLKGFILTLFDFHPYIRYKRPQSLYWTYLCFVFFPFSLWSNFVQYFDDVIDARSATGSVNYFHFLWYVIVIFMVCQFLLTFL